MYMLEIMHVKLTVCDITFWRFDFTNLHRGKNQCNWPNFDV